MIKLRRFKQFIHRTIHFSELLIHYSPGQNTKNGYYFADSLIGCIFVVNLGYIIKIIMRYFNTAGPCNKAEHYMIDAATRLQGVEQLIDMKQYFVIHAARQSGKTTYLRDLAQRLNEKGRYYALYCSLESLQIFKDAEKGIPEIVKLLRKIIRFSNIPDREEFANDADYSYISGVVNMSLSLFCMKIDKPLVLLFDEADCLSEDTLISFMRQLREGYNSRSDIPFVHSIALAGMRNIRDYKANVRPDNLSLGSASPFNIVKESFTLKNFTFQEIVSLYLQHTDATGQLFETDAIELIYKQTQGQPWLVNAVADEVIVKLLHADYTRPVTVTQAHQAIQNIILRRDTHIDSLLERLKEDRVRRVIEPMLSGEVFFDRLSDDYLYVTDLGLIKEVDGKIIPSNPIYAEVITRTLSFDAQMKFMLEKPEAYIPHYLKDGQIDMDYLLQDFQIFWRENSAIWVDLFKYREAAPHLILYAFLQRVLNGGGEIIREPAAGTKRADLCVVYEGKKYPVELKIRRSEKTCNEGLVQTMQYMDTFGCTEGWLVIFDQRIDVSWDDKIFIKKESIEGKTVTVVGM